MLQAEMLALRRLESSPHCVPTLRLLAHLSERRDDLERSGSFLTRAHQLDTKNVELTTDLVMLQLRLGDVRGAIDIAQPLIGPDFPDDRTACLWLLYGHAQAANGNDDLALKVWFRAANAAQSRGMWTNDANTPPGISDLVKQALRALYSGRRNLFENSLTQMKRALGERSVARVENALANYLGLIRDGPKDGRQVPKFFYFPGLTDSPYHDPLNQPWAGELAAAFPAIKREALTLLAESGQFESFLTFGSKANTRDYVTGDGEAPAWDAYFFYRHGERMDTHHARCPETSAILERIERCDIAGQAPEICFSLLAPGSHIMPHYGVTNTRLVMHLPLLVPPDCALNIIDAGEHHWKEGELMMFDDTFQHEAWNRSKLPRLILLLDCWNPELTPEERFAVKGLVETISDFENTF